MLSVKNVFKGYQNAGKSLNILQDVSFDVRAGETVSIVGPSGSGKTTLLGLCAGLDRYDAGSIEVNGLVLDRLNEDQLARLRNEHIGFVFQNFQLLPTLTALENVMVPLELQGANNIKRDALDLLDKVGIVDRASHYPSQLSGGEQQRVALARAFANRPKILFADEPTGNLDTETGQRVEQLIFDLNKEAGTTLVLVTHDVDLAARTERIFHVKAGRLA